MGNAVSPNKKPRGSAGNAWVGAKLLRGPLLDEPSLFHPQTIVAPSSASSRVNGQQVTERTVAHNNPIYCVFLIVERSRKVQDAWSYCMSMQKIAVDINTLS